MQIVLQRADSTTIEEFELIFIPILYQRHYYLMCFNLKTSVVEVIDNNAAEPDATVTVKYSGWVDKMVSYQVMIIYLNTMFSN